MRFVPLKRTVVISILAAAAGGLLLANFVSSSVSAPRANVLGGKATVSPFVMMVQAPLYLPVEQYASY